MKKILFALLIVASFNSCKKCYKCSNGSTYCDGSGEYIMIKNNGDGKTLKDINGIYVADCKAKL